MMTVNARVEISYVDDRQAREIEAKYTYANPKYAELKRLGKWVGDTAPSICYAEISRSSDGMLEVSLPRGVWAASLCDVIGRECVAGALDDREEGYITCYNDDAIEYRPYQHRCLDAVEREDQGVIVAPTGSGKTVIGLGIIAAKTTNALIITHTRELQAQWIEAIGKFLPGATVGAIGGGRKDSDGDIVVATVQTLARRDDLPEVGTVLVDECHHTPASTYGKLLDRIPAKYRYGLTATPQRRDGAHHLLPLYLGKQIATVERKEVEAMGGIVPFDVRFVQHTSGSPGALMATDWMDIKQGLAADEVRNHTISRIAKSECKPTLVLTDYVARAECLAALTGGVLLHGQLPPKRRREAFAAAKSGAPVTVATTGLLGEGIDAKDWHVLILALPFTSKGGRLNQAIGRVVRPAEGKTHARVYDISDSHTSCQSAERGRRAYYKRLGAEVIG